MAVDRLKRPVDRRGLENPGLFEGFGDFGLHQLVDDPSEFLVHPALQYRPYQFADDALERPRRAALGSFRRTARLALRHGRLARRGRRLCRARVRLTMLVGLAVHRLGAGRALLRARRRFGPVLRSALAAVSGCLGQVEDLGRLRRIAGWLVLGLVPFGELAFELLQSLVHRLFGRGGVRHLLTSQAVSLTGNLLMHRPGLTPGCGFQGAWPGREVGEAEPDAADPG